MMVQNREWEETHDLYHHQCIRKLLVTKKQACFVGCALTLPNATPPTGISAK